MTDIFSFFIDACSKKDIHKFAKLRQFPEELLRIYKVGYCDEEIYSELKKKYSVDILKQFGFIVGNQLRYYNRAIIPFSDDYFSARTLDIYADQKKKNYFPMGIPKRPYYLQGLQNDDAYLCEGETDALRLKQHYEDAHIFAITGTMSFGIISQVFNRLKEIKPSRIIFAYDNDAAGEECLKKSLDLLSEMPDIEAPVYQLIFPKEFKDIDDYFKAGNAKDAIALKELQLKASEQDSSSIYGDRPAEELVMSFKEIEERGVPEQKWRVPGLLPERSICIFGGEPGSLKTFAAMQLAWAAVSGTKWLNHFEVKQCNVLYIDEENGDITMPVRLHKLKAGHKIIQGSEKLFISIFNNIKLDTRDNKTLCAMIEKFKPGIVIIDSMVRCMLGDEDKSHDVRKIFDNLKPMLSKYRDLCFILLHHAIKSSGARGLARLRGSGDFGGMADLVYMFRKWNAGAMVMLEKNRHIDVNSMPGFTINFQEVDNGFVMNYSELQRPEDIIEACADLLVDWFDRDQVVEFMTAEAVSEAKSGGFRKNTIYNALATLVNDGTIKKVKRGKYLVTNPRVAEVETIS